MAPRRGPTGAGCAEKSAERLVQRVGYRDVSGRRDRHGRPAHPEVAPRLLLSRPPPAAAHGGEGADGGDAVGLLGVSTRLGDDLVNAQQRMETMAWSLNPAKQEAGLCLLSSRPLE
jgi:hypothetical protein